MFTTLLIANRGEIACRIIRTARQMGIITIAIYSDVDANSLHVKLADEAFCVGPANASASYLNIPKIIDIAKKAGAQAIHPGYGFLSENMAFAKACEAANIIFVGPSVTAMAAMASKQLAKQHLEHTTVPLTPGYHGTCQLDSTLLEAARAIQFPILIKAANGGGGKGMRAVFEEKSFQSALDSARREAKACFDDDTMIIEALIQEPRHIEVQIMADHHGQVVHLYERDCSIQRRHQKIIEEAPAYAMPLAVRQQLTEAAIEVAKTIDYRGAGTVEFIMDKHGSFYFMEMNTRLQVEHPVTEMITGLDLVEWQLRIAANEKLPLSQNDITCHGHAIEARICAEDPAHDFMPSTGEINVLKEPKFEHIRIDTGVQTHTVITPYYDSMIAKCIAWGSTREQAQARLLQALKHYDIGGIKTNLSLLKNILEHPRFTHQQLNTHFIQEEILFTKNPLMVLPLHAAICLDYWLSANHPDPLYQDTFSWQSHLQTSWMRAYLYQQDVFDVTITPIHQNELIFSVLNTGPYHAIEQHYQLTKDGDLLTLNNHQTIHQLHVQQSKRNEWTIFTQDGPETVLLVTPERYQQNSLSTQDHQLIAPMPGTVVSLFKKKGDSIQAGEALLVLEAMKMEHTIRAPYNGVIREIFCAVGTQVNEGITLVDLEQS